MDLKGYFEATWKARGRLLAAAAPLSPEEWTRKFPFSFKSLRDLFAHVIEVEGSWVMENIEKNEWKYPDAAEVARNYATPQMARARGEEVAEHTGASGRVRAPPARRAKARDGDQRHRDHVHGGADPHPRVHARAAPSGEVQAMLRLLAARAGAERPDWIGSEPGSP